MKLEDITKIREELREAEDKLEQLRLVACDVKPSRLDGMPKPKNQSSPVERIAQKIFEAESVVESLRVKVADEALALTEEIYRRVKQSRARHVLIRRYVLGMQWKEIWTDLIISEANVFYWYRLGVKEFNSFKE